DGQGAQARQVIKVVQNLESPQGFLDGAELNQRLREDSLDGENVGRVITIHSKPPYLAYVMPEYTGVLENELTTSFKDKRPPPEWVERVALHIGYALRAAHAGGSHHGNVQASNILFDHA